MALPALTGANLAAAGSIYLTQLAYTLGAIAIIGVVIGLIKIVLGPFRLAASPSVTIDGKPSMKQLSFKEAFTAMGKEITTGIAITYAAYTAIMATIWNWMKGPSGSAPTNINDANQDAMVDSTKYNPYRGSIQADLYAVTYYSTATTSTVLYLAGNTGTTVGAYWWSTIAPALADTATNSISSVLYTALIVTDNMCGVDGSLNLMGLEDVIDASQQQIEVAESLPLGAVPLNTPTLETFVGTIYNSGYLNSCTTALNTLFDHADTSTTTLLELQGDFALLNTATQNLSFRINDDVGNQAAFIYQSNRLTSLDERSLKLDKIQKNYSPDISSFYRTTVHPDALELVDNYILLKDLQSANTATQAAAAAKINAQA
jgi:hypothetical protein